MGPRVPVKLSGAEESLITVIAFMINRLYPGVVEKANTKTASCIYVVLERVDTETILRLYWMTQLLKIQ